MSFFVHQHSTPHEPHCIFFSFCLLGSPISTFHSSPVLRILLYLEGLPVLQSLHHLFVLDFSVHWPNKNTAFIVPGGLFTERTTADTNIPTLNSYPPAAISSKSVYTIPQSAGSPCPVFPAACWLLHGSSSCGLDHWWHLSPLQRQARKTGPSWSPC